MTTQQKFPYSAYSLSLFKPLSAAALVRRSLKKINSLIITLGTSKFDLGIKLYYFIRNMGPVNNLDFEKQIFSIKNRNFFHQ